MWTGFTDSGVLLDLAGKGASEVHGSRAELVGLEPEHAGGGKLVVSAAAARLLLDLDHVDRVPAALDLLGVAVPCLLYQYHA